MLLNVKSYPNFSQEKCSFVLDLSHWSIPMLLVGIIKSINYDLLRKIFFDFFSILFQDLRTQSCKYEVLGGQLPVTFYWVHITFAFSMLILWSPLIIFHWVNMRANMFICRRKCKSKSPHNVEQNCKDLGNQNNYLMFIRYSRKYGHNPAEFDALLHVNVPQLSSTTVTQSFQKAVNIPPCALCPLSSLPEGYVCYHKYFVYHSHTLEMWGSYNSRRQPSTNREWKLFKYWAVGSTLVVAMEHTLTMSLFSFNRLC